MAKNFPNTMKAINPKIQETQYTPSDQVKRKKEKKKKATSKYTALKMLKTKDKTKF